MMSYTPGYGHVNAPGGRSQARIDAKGDTLVTKFLLDRPKASRGEVVISRYAGLAPGGWTKNNSHLLTAQ